MKKNDVFLSLATIVQFCISLMLITMSISIYILW